MFRSYAVSLGYVLITDDLRDFAKMAKPLHSLTQKNASFKWTEKCQEAFVKLKEHLSQSPVLIYPDSSSEFILDTDASHLAIGAVLSQMVDGKEHPVAHFSRTLNQPEQQYCVTRKELLAVVQSIEHFHPYFIWQTFSGMNRSCIAPMAPQL